MRWLWIILLCLAQSVEAASIPQKFSIVPGSNIANISSGIAGTSNNSKAFGPGTSSGVNNTDTNFLQDSTQNILVTVDSTAGQTAHNLDWTISRQFFNSKPPVIGLWVYFPDQTKWTNCSVFLTPNAFTDYYTVSFAFIHALKVGWNYYQFHKEDFSIGGGAPSWTSTMTTMRLQCVGVAGQIGTMYVDQNYAEYATRPSVVFSFDGNDLSTYTIAYPMLAAKNWKGSLYLTGSTLGQGGFLTDPQLQELQGVGWDILNHTQTSPDLTTLNAEQIKQELLGMERSASAHGLRVTARHMVYPQGNHNTVTENAVRDAGYLTGADASGQTQTPMIFAKGIDGSPWRVLRVGLDNTVSLAQAQTEIEQAIRNGGMVEFLIHILAGSAGVLQWSQTDFQSLVNYLAAREPQISVLTMSRWYQGYLGQHRQR